MIIISLAPHHDRTGFDCGEEKVNIFLKERARKHATLNMSRTSVLVEDETSPRIMGYHATLVTSVEPARVPVKKLPPQGVPMLLLAWLGVDQQYQGRQLGKLLLFDVLNRARIIAEQTALHGVILDALTDQALAMYLKLGFTSLKDEVRGLFMPIGTILELTGK